MRYVGELSPGLQRFLKGLELVHPLLGVALADLTQGLVLVPADPDVLGVEQVVLGLLVVVPGLFQLGAQGLPTGETRVITTSRRRDFTPKFHPSE